MNHTSLEVYFPFDWTAVQVHNWQVFQLGSLSHCNYHRWSAHWFPCKDNLRWSLHYL